MVCLPGGSFMFGNAFPGEGYIGEESAAALAQVSAFAVDATEVTNQQFAAFVNATGHVTGACITASRTASSGLNTLLSPQTQSASVTRLCTRRS